MHTIVPAEKVDLPAILSLQLRAYKSEAEICQNPNIPPLLQTLSDLENEYSRGVFLKGVDAEGQIIGSVRGFVDNNIGYIGKLIVEPELQGRGLGSALLHAIEEMLDVNQFELFTSASSERNLGLYQRRGYKITKESILSDSVPKLRLIYLTKTR